MNELIKVDYTGERPAVSARELHEFLEVETPYHKWFPRMCEYGFTENEDYSVTDIFVRNPAGGPQSMKDAAVSIDMAKEICMIQRNEKGKLARQYFLALERDWNSPEKVMSRALRYAEQELKQVRALNSALTVETPSWPPWYPDPGDAQGPRDIPPALHQIKGAIQRGAGPTGPSPLPVIPAPAAPCSAGWPSAPAQWRRFPAAPPSAPSSALWRRRGNNRRPGCSPGRSSRRHGR